MDAKLFAEIHRQPVLYAIFTEYLKRSAGIDERLLVEHIPEEVLIEMIVALSEQLNQYKTRLEDILNSTSYPIRLD